MAKVVLDPGHFKGHNPGAVAGYAEGTAMYEYAQKLADLLRRAGVEVILTRKSVEDNPTLTQRGKMAKGADLFLSLHSNGVTSPAANGVSVFYSIKRPHDAQLAADWSKLLSKYIGGGTRDRGAHTRKGGGDWDYYTVIQSSAATDCPRILLVEHGFHSNPKECAWLMQDDNLLLMATLECNLICDALGVQETSQNAPESNGWEKQSNGSWKYKSRMWGYLCSQWIRLGGKWYYLMADGTMAEGWAQIGGKWYYLTPGSGAMVTGDVQIDGKTHHFAESGALADE